jgi:hypothetical protein
MRHLSRFPLILLALPALALARELPADGIGLGLRLGTATLCLLLPGLLLARALRTPGLAAGLAFSLTLLAGALGVVFVLHTSIEVALAILAGAALVALPLAVWRGAAPLPSGSLVVLGLGAAFGVALWQVAAPLEGDALFHLARVRKLWAFDELSLEGVGEFRDGGLHPGYAFPLWHGFLALVAKLAGVDPAVVALHEASVLAPLAFALVYEAGVALFRSRSISFALVLAQAALIGLAPGKGGAYAFLALPATASRQLLVPAVLALVFAHLVAPRLAWLGAIAAGGLALAIVHPTYAVFLCLPLGGFLVARALLSHADHKPLGAALAALAVPSIAVALAIVPLVRATASHTPTGSELRRAFTHYAGQIDVFSETSYRLAPEVFGRGGAVAVAALLLIPLAALASRRRWAAFVLGGSIAVFAVTLVRFLFPRFADVVSISQARRAAGFVPLAFAFAGGLAVLAEVFSAAVLPLAFSAGLLLQAAYPGDFGYTFQGGGPALASWVAALGGAAALVAAPFVRRLVEPLERRGLITAVAAALFVAPVAAHAALDWSSREPRGRELSPGLVRALEEYLPEGATVFSHVETSYRIAAYAPVYVAAAPPGHVADTHENRPYARRRDVEQFFRTGDFHITSRYGAGWLVVSSSRSRLEIAKPIVWADERYALYRL